MRRKVVLINSPEYAAICDVLEADKKKYSLTWRLLQAYGLHQTSEDGGYLVIPPRNATHEELLEFHDEEYVHALTRFSRQWTCSNCNVHNLLTRTRCLCCGQRQNESEKEERDDDDDEDEEDCMEELERFGLVDDCPVFAGLHKYILATTGASLLAAQALEQRKAHVAINWGGGRHHAKSSLAGGYCYVNDIVLAIFRLQRVFKKVLYVDLDAHHGDGVAKAFSRSASVFTLSLHRCPPMFPGRSGRLGEKGVGRGTSYNLNIPLQEGCCDSSFVNLFKHTFEQLLPVFQPDAIVVQCGADALARDPSQAELNLSSASLQYCVRLILQAAKPTLILGGGGYNAANTARLWASVTGIAAGVRLPDVIPDHPDIMLYKPNFSLAVPSVLSAIDRNSPPVLRQLLKHITMSVANLRLAMVSKPTPTKRVLGRKRTLSSAGDPPASTDPPEVVEKDHDTTSTPAENDPMGGGSSDSFEFDCPSSP